MKHILTLFFLIPFAIKAQDNTLITNLQLKGGTVKLIVAVLKKNNSADTSVLNMYHKWREDYIDGSVPNDNANVTVSTTKTVNVILIYGLLLNLPGGYRETTDYIAEFKTSVQSKRATNPILDAGLTDLETMMAAEINALLSIGGGDLQSK
jgi:hypothetical protein